jgi:hypothetical protein
MIEECNTAPYLSEDPENSEINCEKDWVYTLPEVKDDEGHDYKVSLEMESDLYFYFDVVKGLKGFEKLVKSKDFSFDEWENGNKLIIITTTDKYGKSG